MSIVRSIAMCGILVTACTDSAWQIDLPLASTRGPASCTHADRISLSVEDPSGNPRVSLPGWDCTCLGDESVGCASDGGKLLITPASVELAIDGCVFKFHE